MKYLICICLSLALANCIKLKTPNIHEITNTSTTDNDNTNSVLTNNLLIDDNTVDNYTIILETLNTTNIVQILGASDFVNATAPLHQIFSILLEGNPSAGGAWFITNKEALSEYITPIDIEDDGLTNKFIPEKNLDTGITNEGTYVFNFKSIKATTEPIELRFEQKHAWDPMAVRIVLVSMTIS